MEHRIISKVNRSRTKGKRTSRGYIGHFCSTLIIFLLLEGSWNVIEKMNFTLALRSGDHHGDDSNIMEKDFLLFRIRLDQFNSSFLVQFFHQSHASERKQNKNVERKQKRIYVRSVCRGETSHLNSGSTYMEHQNRHATSVIVLSYKQSRYLNAHVHKLQHSARSRLFNDLFLPHGSPRISFHLFA